MAPRQRSITSSTSTDDSFPDTSTSSSDSSSEEREKLLTSPSRNTQSPPTTTTTTAAATATTATPSTFVRTEADIARDAHDFFNVFALGFIVCVIFLNYDINSITSFEYTGKFFWTLWGSTGMYFIADLLWVTIVPICVKSPHVIVKHHIAAMIYLFAPIYFPVYRRYIGGILSVEINTWLLIVRRLVYRTNAPPVSPLICTTVSVLFYVTWIVIRCYVYPLFLKIYWDLWVTEVNQSGIFFHPEMVFIPVHAVLCLLNLKWTYDLFKPIISKWMGTGPKTIAVQSGL